jgi:hypothetical protein
MRLHGSQNIRYRIHKVGQWYFSRANLIQTTRHYCNYNKYLIILSPFRILENIWNAFLTCQTHVTWPTGVTFLDSVTLIIRTMHSVNNSLLLCKRVSNLTPWSTDLLKLLWPSKVKKSPSIYRIRMFVVELERARHSFIYWSRRIQTIPSCSLRLTSCLLIYYSIGLILILL